MIEFFVLENPEEIGESLKLSIIIKETDYVTNMYCKKGQQKLVNLPKAKEFCIATNVNHKRGIDMLSSIIHMNPDTKVGLHFWLT